MELEAIEPPHRGLATAGVDPKHAVLLDPRGMTDGERSRVDEADARAGPQLRVQIDRQGNKEARHQLHEAGVTEEARKILAEGGLHVTGVERLEGAIAGLLEENQDGQDLRRVQPRRPSASALS
jgi:hypothetical protein